MKNIKKKIEELNCVIEEINKDNNEQKNIYYKISEILKDLNEKVEEVLVNQAALAENMKYMDQDISGIQDELFEEVSVEDLEEMEDTEYKEIKCKECGKIIYIEESALKGSKELKCPYFNNKIDTL